MSILTELEDMGIPEVVQAVTEETPHPAQPQWAKFRPLFEEAMKQGGQYTIEDVERKLAQGIAIFFPGKDAAIVAERVQYATETLFQVLWAVGDLEECLALAPGVESIGRNMGCTGMIIEGRKGWERMLKPMGYEFWSLTVKKAL